MIHPNKTKYRPVLSPEQIAHILYLAKREVPISELSFSLIATLSPFQAKIDSQAINPAYVQVQQGSKPSMLESLGGEVTVLPSDDMIGVPESINPNLSYRTKEEYWATCYAKYRLLPESCTVLEIKAAQEHMYLNDLMSPEEMVQFERQAFANTEQQFLIVGE